MTLAKDDPYRLWIEELNDIDLEYWFWRTLPLPIDVNYRENPASFLGYCGWPLKASEGTVSIIRSAAGNPKYRYTGIWQREMYKNGRWDNDNTMGEYSDGPHYWTCLMRLWLLTVENMYRENDNIKWKYELGKMIRIGKS